MTNATVTSARAYADESNGLVDGAAYHGDVDHSETFSLADVKAAGGRITRVRILREGRYCDISYIHATLADGRIVPVSARVNNLTDFYKLKGAFIEWAKSEGVFAKSLGLLDDGVWSVLN